MNRFYLPLCRILLLGLLLAIYTGFLHSQTTVNTIDELRALDPGASDEVIVLGYYNAGDWGEARVFRWVQPSTAADNGGTVIVPSTASTGRWIMRVTESYYNVKWFGARGQDNPDHNDHIAILNCIEEAAVNNKDVLFPVGIYQVREVIRLDYTHNGMTIFGEQVTETTELHTIMYGPRAGQQEERRIVDFNNSAIIRRADTGPYGSPFLLFTARSEPYIDDITIKRLVFDGNRHVAENAQPDWERTKANNALSLRHQENVGYKGIYLEDIYVIRGGAKDDNTTFGIQGDNITIKGLLIYDSYHHGMISLSYTESNKPTVYMEDVEIWGIEYQFAYDASGKANIRGSKVEIKNFYFHDARRGMKTQDAEVVRLINGKFQDTEGAGFRTGDSYTQDWFVELYMENIIFQDIRMGLYLHQDLEEAKLFNINLKNTGASIAQPNVEIYGLISDGYDLEEGYPIRIYGSNADVIIHDLIIKNANKTIAGLDVFRGNAVIRSGEIINNESSGIHIRDGGTLTLFNTKLGDTQPSSTQLDHEIYGNGTLYYSGLDFTESAVSPENRIRVDDAIEVANATLISPYKNGRFFKEDAVEIEARAAAPNASVQRIEFFANDVKIGEVRESPYIFSWVDMEEGKYIVKAVATFTDNTEEVSNTVTITIRSREKTQILFLNPGWNTVSTYVEPHNTDIEILLYEIKDNISLLNNNYGDVYWPSYNINEIGNWDYREGYQVFMDDADTLTVTGLSLLPDETPIHLSKGWNLTAYILDRQIPVENAFNSIGHTVQLVTNNEGEIYWPEYGVNSIGYVHPGQGYRIFVGSDADLIYPTESDPSLKLLAGGNQIRHNNTETFIPKHYVLNGRNTGTSAILLVQSGKFLNGDEIGVWSADGVLVGSGVALNKRAAVTVWGKNTLLQNESFGAETGERLRLTVWRSGEKREYPLDITGLSAVGKGELEDNALVFEPNSIVIAGVDIRNDVPVRYTLEQNFPNPFNPTTTIVYNIPGNEPVTLTIYNLLGQKVATLVDEEQPAGSYEVVFKADRFASGVYFYRLIAGNYTEIKRMILLR